MSVDIADNILKKLTVIEDQKYVPEKSIEKFNKIIQDLKLIYGNDININIRNMTGILDKNAHYYTIHTIYHYTPKNSIHVGLYINNVAPPKISIKSNFSEVGRKYLYDLLLNIFTLIE